MIRFLKQTGQYDNTLVVFTCDHGEQLGDHHLLGKLGYFDESFRIPLVIYDPSPEANSGRGDIVGQFTETIDVMPTILAWLGMEASRPCDGVSLLHGCMTCRSCEKFYASGLEERCLAYRMHIHDVG